jgi:hypothetical protein
VELPEKEPAEAGFKLEEKLVVIVLPLVCGQALQGS